MYKIGLSVDTGVLLIGNFRIIRFGSFSFWLGVGWGRISDFTQDSVEYFIGRRSWVFFVFLISLQNFYLYFLPLNLSSPIFSDIRNFKGWHVVAQE